MLIPDMKTFLILLTILTLVNAEVPLASFFPYGTENGDAKLQNIDDGSSPPQNLSIAFPFFNVPQSTLWVNENGIITFDRKSSQFTPYCKPVPFGGGRIVAPFWADVDIRHTGNIFYRQTTNAAILQKGEHEIAQAFSDEQNIHLSWAFIATWEDVTYFQDLGNHNESERKKNTFQATLLTDGVQGFAIFYYNKITWTTGDVSGGHNGLGGTPAEIGYDYGDSLNYFTVNDSCKDSVINITQKSNVGNAGQMIFKLGAKIDVSPTPLPGCQDSYTGEFCAIPNTIDFVGSGLIHIYGIQLTSTESAICRFNDPGANITEFDGNIITLSHITCLRPNYIFTIGRVPLEIEIYDNVSKNMSHTYSGYIYSQYLKKDTLTVEFGDNTKDTLVWRLKWDPETFEESPGEIGGKAAISFGITQLCTLLANEAIEGAKKQAEVIAHQSPCIIEGNDLFHGGVTCYFNSKSTPWFKNACPGAEPLDFGCIAIGSLIVSAAAGPEAVPVFLAAVALDFAIGLAIECGPRMIGQACKAYEDNDNQIQNENLIDSVFNYPVDVPPCPPTFALANVDPTFIVDSLCTDNTNCMYNPGADICYISATPSPSGGAQHCCYSKGEINITNPAAGHPMTVHPFFQAGIPNMVTDRNPFLYCCGIINNILHYHICDKPTDPATNYTAPKPALGNGDPHFTTFDGLYYTFNGAGEFWMLKNSTSQPLAVQTRMVPVGTSYSYFGAYAMKTENSSVLQIERSSTGDFTVYYNSIPIPPNIWQKGINFDDIYISYDGAVTVTFSCGFSFKISYWMVNTFAPRSYFGNYTQGILGSYDGNPFNDLTTPDGILLPANSSTEVIHYKFGLKWSVSEDESLFNYFGKNYSDFNFPEFKPTFGYSAGQLPPNAAEICGSDQSCLWDLVTTGDETLANETRSNNEDFNQTVSTTSQNITMCPILDEIENGSFVLNNYLPYSVVTFYCDSGFEIQGDSSLICKSDGSWNGTEPFCEFAITTTTETTTSSPSSTISSSLASVTTTTPMTSTSFSSTTTTSDTTTSKAKVINLNLIIIWMSFFLSILIKII